MGQVSRPAPNSSHDEHQRTLRLDGAPEGVETTLLVVRLQNPVPGLLPTLRGFKFAIVADGKAFFPMRRAITGEPAEGPPGCRVGGQIEGGFLDVLVGLVVAQLVFETDGEEPFAVAGLSALDDENRRQSIRQPMSVMR